MLIFTLTGLDFRNKSLASKRLVNNTHIAKLENKRWIFASFRRFPYEQLASRVKLQAEKQPWTGCKTLEWW